MLSSWIRNHKLSWILDQLSGYFIICDIFLHSQQEIDRLLGRVIFLISILTAAFVLDFLLRFQGWHIHKVCCSLHKQTNYMHSFLPKGSRKAISPTSFSFVCCVIPRSHRCCRLGDFSLINSIPFIKFLVQSFV